MPDWILLALYFVAALLVASGAALIRLPAGLIVAGVLVAAISYLATDDGK